MVEINMDSLTKSLKDSFSRIDEDNFRIIADEILNHDLIRARAIFPRICLEAQIKSPEYTDLFATIVAKVNAKNPQLGLLLLRALILTIRNIIPERNVHYEFHEKNQFFLLLKFVGGLVNEKVVSPQLCIEIFNYLLKRTRISSYAVEGAISLIQECGRTVQELYPGRFRNDVIGGFRLILCIHIDKVDNKVKSLLRKMIKAYRTSNRRRNRFQDGFRVDKNMHIISFYDEIHPKDKKLIERMQLTKLNVEEEVKEEAKEDVPLLVNLASLKNSLKKTVYSVMKSSRDPQNAAHRLIQIGIEPSQMMLMMEVYLECMIEDVMCTAYYAHVAKDMCKESKAFSKQLKGLFEEQYIKLTEPGDRKERQIRTLGSFFAELLCHRVIPWRALSVIRIFKGMTSAADSFAKCLFECVRVEIGSKELRAHVLHFISERDTEFCKLFFKKLYVDL